MHNQGKNITLLQEGLSEFIGNFRSNASRNLARVAFSFSCELFDFLGAVVDESAQVNVKLRPYELESRVPLVAGEDDFQVGLEAAAVVHDDQNLLEP